MFKGQIKHQRDSMKAEHLIESYNVKLIMIKWLSP